MPQRECTAPCCTIMHNFQRLLVLAGVYNLLDFAGYDLACNIIPFLNRLYLACFRLANCLFAFLLLMFNSRYVTGCSALSFFTFPDC